MASDLVRAHEGAKRAARAVRLTMTADDVHEVLSTLLWLDELPARPSDDDVDQVRAEAIADWLRELMLDHAGASVALSLPTRDDIREALAERRAGHVIDFASAAARLRSRESAAV